MKKKLADLLSTIATIVYFIVEAIIESLEDKHDEAE